MYSRKFVKLRILTTSRKLLIRTYCEKNCNLLSQIMSISVENAENTQNSGADVKDTVKPQSRPYLDVLGSGAKGAPACVMLQDINSYVINCGEGTSKLAGEYRVKLNKSVNSFITYPSWKNMAGLVSLALSLQETGTQQMVIHGDASIKYLFSSVTKFVRLRNVKVEVNRSFHYKEFTDGYINVTSVLIHPNSCIGLNENASDSALETGALGSSDIDQNYEEEIQALSKHPISHTGRRDKREKTHGKKRTQSENCAQTKQEIHKKCNKPAISFIFRTSKTLGHLNLEKCLEFGVSPGPLLGQLKNGIDVTLENGTVVLSQDVKEPDMPGVNFIAVECPTEDYLDSLLGEPIFSKYQSGENVAGAIIHFTPSEVVKSSKYKEWINRFPKETRHLFINEDNSRATSVAIHRQQFKLNLLQPDLFPLLYEPHVPNFPRINNTSTPDGHVVVSLEVLPSKVPIYMDRVFYKCVTNNFIQGETMCRMFLRSDLEFDYYKCLVLNYEKFSEEVFLDDSKKEIIDNYKSKLKEMVEKIKSDNRIYPKIVFLGTGSSRPSKTRAQSGILIFVEENKCILLDCGEYTYGQLLNLYGEEASKDVLKNLHAIYISHMHCDHHLGLITIMKKRKEVLSELQKISEQELFKPVFVLAPTEIFRWLTMYSDMFENISDLYELIPNSVLLYDGGEYSVKANLCKKLLNLKRLETALVHHCYNAYGISLVHQEGWKITYSGDTKPCQNLVELGKGSNILIHEATFEDVCVKEAAVKLHSTARQAIAIGAKMMAKNILLTHFSQKYSNLPKIEDVISTINTGIAFDFMQVPYNMLPLLQEVIEPLQYIFPKYYDKNEKRTQVFLQNEGNRIPKWEKIFKRSAQDFSTNIPTKIVKSNI